MFLRNLPILASDDPLEHVVQHDLFTVHIGQGFAFSNHMLMVLLASLILVVVFPLVLRRKSTVPSGLANFIESICVYLREEMVYPALGEQTDRFVKYIWTLFFFILTCNLLGLMPLDSIVFVITRKSFIGGTATANIWITASLAIVSFLVTHVTGIIHQGPIHYLKNFIPPVPWPMIPFMYVLEIMGAIIKPFSLAIRLFANMLAGHTVLGALIMIAMASHNYGVTAMTLLSCAAFSLLELFVAFLQAYIFAFLTTIYIASAIHPEH